MQKLLDLRACKFGIKDVGLSAESWEHLGRNIANHSVHRERKEYAQWCSHHLHSHQDLLQAVCFGFESTGKDWEHALACECDSCDWDWDDDYDYDSYHDADD